MDKDALDILVTCDNFLLETMLLITVIMRNNILFRVTKAKAT